MHVFVVFAPDDATRAAELTAELMEPLTARGLDLGFRVWVADPYPGSGALGGGRPQFLDAAGRVLADDAHAITSALGVLVVVTDRAAGSDLVRAQIEIAYSCGTSVAGLHLDPPARPPRNLSSHNLLPPDPVKVVELIARWSEQQRRRATRPWWTRLRRILRADRDHGR